MKAAKKTKEFADPQTGEIRTVCCLFPEAVDRENHLKIFQVFSRKVVEDLIGGLGSGTCVLLFWILDRLLERPMNSDPEIDINPHMVAEELGIGLSTASLYLGNLRKYEYIHQVNRGHHKYQIDPRMVFKGCVAEWEAKRPDYKGIYQVPPLAARQRQGKKFFTKALVDPATSQVHNVVVVAPEFRDTGTFVKFFQLFSKKVLQDLVCGFGAGTCGSLFWIIDQLMYLELDEDPVIAIDPAVLAEETNIGFSTAKLHIKTLRGYGYIEKVRSRSCLYRINPQMVFKGTLSNYEYK